MIGILMILSSALVSKSKSRRPTGQPDDAYQREARYDCALQCHSLEQERENAPLQRASIWTERQNVLTQSKKKKSWFFLFSSVKDICWRVMDGSRSWSRYMRKEGETG